MHKKIYVSMKVGKELIKIHGSNIQLDWPSMSIWACASIWAVDVRFQFRDQIRNPCEKLRRGLFWIFLKIGKLALMANKRKRCFPEGFRIRVLRA